MSEPRGAAEELLRRGEPREAARLFLQDGDTARAVDALVAAAQYEDACGLALDSGNAERALLLAARHDLPTLLTAAESALLLRQGRTPAQLARMLLGLGKHARAAEWLASAGDHAGAAALFEQVGRRERAAEQWLSAGQPPRAALMWERHLSENPRDVRARLGLARILLAAGKERDAVAQAQAALRTQPDHEDAMKLVALGLERMGFTDGAAMIRDRMVKSLKLPALPRDPDDPTELGLGSVGRYELLDLLGQGTSATVYRARDRWSGDLVALKRMRADLEESPDALHRFLLEARLASRLSHPNIVMVIEADERGKTLAMELLEGGTLQALIAAGPIPLLEIRRLILQAFEGIGRAHFEGIVHRDLKPSNLLLTASGVLKIADFGVAHVIDSSWTRSGTVVGTYGYLAPEQLQGQPAQASTDLYALGAVLYEMVCGRPPFSGRDLVRDHLDRAVPWPARLGGAVSPSLGNAMLRLLAKSPLDRFATPRDAVAALSAADWQLEPTTTIIEPPREPALSPNADQVEVESSPFDAQRFHVLAEGSDALGTWRRVEDRWLQRRVFERQYTDEMRAGPLLERLAAVPTGRLPTLVRCDPASGRAAWIEFDFGPFETGMPDLQLLSMELREVDARLSLETVGAHSIGRLPDGVCVLTSADPLVEATRPSL